VLAFLGQGETGMPSVIAPVPHVHEGKTPGSAATAVAAPGAPTHVHADSRRA
jgi:hypothetical protein